MFFSAASFSLGFVSGFGTGFVTRELSHVSTVALRPAFKELIKSSMQIADRSREAFARAGEHFEDIIAEARSEIGEGRRQEAGQDRADTVGDEQAEQIVVTSEGGVPSMDQTSEPRVAAGG